MPRFDEQVEVVIVARPAVFSFVFGVPSSIVLERCRSAGILTLGVALILQNGGLFLFGSAPVSIATPLASSAWTIGPLHGDLVEVFVNQGQTWSAAIAGRQSSGCGVHCTNTKLPAYERPCHFSARSWKTTSL